MKSTIVLPQLDFISRSSPRNLAFSSLIRLSNFLSVVEIEDALDTSEQLNCPKAADDKLVAKSKRMAARRHRIKVQFANTMLKRGRTYGDGGPESNRFAVVAHHPGRASWNRPMGTKTRKTPVGRVIAPFGAWSAMADR